MCYAALCECGMSVFVCMPYVGANRCLLADDVSCNVRNTHLYAPRAKISQVSLSYNSNQAAYVTIACRCSFGKGTEK